MLRVIDLFSGIGGFSLGLERTGGFRTVYFCEIDPFCRRVLVRRWPGTPCHEDVTKVEFQIRDRHMRIARRWRGVMRTEIGGAL